MKDTLGGRANVGKRVALRAGENKIRERFPKKRGKKQPQITWDNILFFVFAFLHIFQNFPCTLGEKNEKC